MQLAVRFGAQIESYRGRLRLTWPEGSHWYDPAPLMSGPILQALSSLSVPTDVEEAVDLLQHLTGESPARCRATLDALVDVGVLAEVDSQADRTSEVAAVWEHYGWPDAFHYHLTVESAERLDYGTPEGLREDVASMKRYVQAESPPPNTLTFESAPRYDLPAAPSGHGDLAASFGLGSSSPVRGPLSMDELAFILFFTLGSIGIKRLPVTGEHVRRAVPSGGSRHPTEALVLLGPDNELPEGAYHYAGHDHALYQLDEDPVEDWVQQHVVEVPNWVDFTPRVTLVFFSIVARNRYRYRESFTYRPVHHDVGHVLEQNSLILRSLGRVQFGGYGVDAAALAERLGINALEAPGMAFMTIG